MRYIDSHCHLDFPDFHVDFAQVLQRMKDNDVGAITIGTDLESSKRAVKIAESHENIWACIGIHPSENGEFDKNEFSVLSSSPKVVGIGECGLDYFRLDREPEFADVIKKKQREIFESQINFALEKDLPLMLHCRAAYQECLDILESFKKDYGEKLRGNCHFFAGTIDEANCFIKLGFTLSFTGVITFTSDYDEVIESLPIDSILSETDAPFVAPTSHRGKRNEPTFVVEVSKKLALLKQVSEDEMASQLVQNAVRVFDLKIGN